MAKLLEILKLFFFISLIINPFRSFGEVSPIYKNSPSIIQTSPKNTIKNIEKRLGRKLKFKERILVRILKKKAKKENTRERTLSSAALFLSFTAFIPYFGIVTGLLGILFGLISFSFTNRVKNKKAHKKRAVIAIIVGILFTALNLLFVVAMAIGRSM